MMWLRLGSLNVVLLCLYCDLNDCDYDDGVRMDVVDGDVVTLFDLHCAVDDDVNVVAVERLFVGFEFAVRDDVAVRHVVAVAQDVVGFVVLAVVVVAVAVAFEWRLTIVECCLMQNLDLLFLREENETM